MIQSPESEKSEARNLSRFQVWSIIAQHLPTVEAWLQAILLESGGSPVHGHCFYRTQFSSTVLPLAKRLKPS